MDIISVIILAVSVSAFIYYIFLEEETNFLQERLEKISNKNNDEENLENKKNDIKNFLMLYTKPLLNTLAGKDKNKRTIKNLLAEAGESSSDENVFKFIATRLIYCVIGFLFSLALVMLIGLDENSLMIALAVPIALYILPIFSLRAKAKKRSEEISYTLPDALDLLTVCVEAGLGLDAALSRVAKEFRRTSEVLATEFDRVSRDILAGVSRQDAFRNLALRNNVPEVKSFSALLIQTDKLGTSISQSLRVHCDTVRTRRRQRVEELAQKASVKMTIPLVLFVLPAMFLVIMSPAIINLMRNMK